MLMGEALQNLREFLRNKGLLDKKTIVPLLVLLVTLLLLPLGIFLVKNRTVFLPQAAGELISLGEGGCIKLDKDKKKVVDCITVPLKLVNPYYDIKASNKPVSSATPIQSAGVSAQPLFHWCVF